MYNTAMWLSLLLLTSVLCTRVQADLQEEVDQLKIAVQRLSTEVGYEAQSEDDVEYADHTKIKFTDVEYNAGDGYNEDTGIFTVPISGTYLLWAHIMRSHYGRMAVFIKGSGGTLLTGYITEGHYTHGVASVTGLAYLEQGDSIFVCKQSWQNETVKGSAYSSYGGVLLKAH